MRASARRQRPGTGAGRFPPDQSMPVLRRQRRASSAPCAGLQPCHFHAEAGGASNYVAPQATLNALVPTFNYFAAWYLLAVVGFLFLGIETRGRTIEELDAALARPVLIKAGAR